MTNEEDIGTYEVGRMAMPYILRSIERTLEKQFPTLNKEERTDLLKDMDKIISQALFH